MRRHELTKKNTKTNIFREHQRAILRVKTWSSFFERKKKCFARIIEKSSDDDNDGCNGNYDNNDGNFENIQLL